MARAYRITYDDPLYAGVGGSILGARRAAANASDRTASNTTGRAPHVHQPSAVFAVTRLPRTEQPIQPTNHALLLTESGHSHPSVRDQVLVQQPLPDTANGYMGHLI